MTERCLVMGVRPAYARGVTDAVGPDVPSVGEIRQKYEQARAAIEGIAEPGRAYDAASQLREVVDDLVGDAAILRARMAHRMILEEGLSLAALASRLHISKTRADQLIRLAKTSIEEAPS